MFYRTNIGNLIVVKKNSTRVKAARNFKTSKKKYSKIYIKG